MLHSRAIASLLLVGALACNGPARVVTTSGAPTPIGPYSQAMARGEFLFLSGQIGSDPVTGALVSGGIVPETERMLANIEAVLAAEGLGFEHVVSVQAYMVDLAEFGAFNAAYAKAMGTNAPARATVQVAALPKGARIEVQCTAIGP